VVEILKKLRENKSVSQKKALTADDVLKMMACCDTTTLRGKRDRALIAFCFNTGGRRRSEASGAKLENLSAEDSGNYLYEIDVYKKKKEGARLFVPIKGIAAEAITDWLQASGIREGAIFRKVNRQDEVEGSDGLSGEAIRQITRLYVSMIGLPADSYGPHSFRSGFVTEANRQGIQLLDAMALTGHVQVQTIQGYYRAGDALHNPAGDLLGKTE
jgi:integrase